MFYIRLTDSDLNHTGIYLYSKGKKVLFIDAGPWTTSLPAWCLGWQNQDSLPTTLTTVMEKVIRDEAFITEEGISPPKKVFNKISFYGLETKNMDILGFFRYAISKKQRSERYDYPTTI